MCRMCRKGTALPGRRQSALCVKQAHVKMCRERWWQDVCECQGIHVAVLPCAQSAHLLEQKMKQVQVKDVQGKMSRGIQGRGASVIICKVKERMRGKPTAPYFFMAHALSQATFSIKKL